LNIIKNCDLSRVLEPLSFLAETPWRINDRIYQIVDHMWKKVSAHNNRSIRDATPMRASMDGVLIPHFLCVEPFATRLGWRICRAAQPHGYPAAGGSDDGLG